MREQQPSDIGSAGFAMRGLRPKEHAPRYQRVIAAIRSHSPIAKSTAAKVAMTKNSCTKNDESQTARRFGKR